MVLSGTTNISARPIESGKPTGPQHPFSFSEPEILALIGNIPTLKEPGGPHSYSTRSAQLSPPPNRIDDIPSNPKPEAITVPGQNPNIDSAKSRITSPAVQQVGSTIAVLAAIAPGLPKEIASAIRAYLNEYRTLQQAEGLATANA